MNKELNHVPLRELHLFAGAGGGILGGILCGHVPVCAVELEKYPRDVLLQRQRDGILPWFPVWDDVCTFDGLPWAGKVDVICGGFPCQDISAAGKGAGITGERSGLWSEMARIISEVGPEWVFVENSPELVRKGLGTVLGGLASMGYDSRWGVLGAADVGAYHQRDRLWILGHSRKNRGLHVCGGSFEGEGDMEFSIPIVPPVDRNLEGFHPTRIERTPAPGAEESCLPPYLCRVDHDMARNVDRLAAIGNGQVPAVVRLAWWTLMARFQR